MRLAKALVGGSAALVVLAIAAAPLDVVRGSIGSAYAAQVAAVSSVADSTYGAGGTKESYSNDKREVMAEIWRDKNGNIREQYEAADDGVQYWGFFQGEGFTTSEWGGTITVKPMTRPAGRWDMTVYGPGYVPLKEYSFLSREDLDREFNHWHSQMRGWVNGFINPAPG